MNKYSFFILLLIICFTADAQVAQVEFGRNRVQYKKKFKWEYFQTENFQTYHYQNGKDIAKFAAQVAELELPQIEEATNERLQRKAMIVVYNEYNEYKQSNIGASYEGTSDDGTTRLVNNKIFVYFNGNHEDLRRQIRQGIAKTLVSNKLFGANVGQVVSNTATLDLPEWASKGYIEYITENWNTTKDDELKDKFLSGRFTKFSSIAYHYPSLAGHAFWYYVEEKYGKEEVNKLLNASIGKKSINKATKLLFQTKLKNVFKEFMEFEDTKYAKDVEKRRQYPKGSEIETFYTGKRKDYYHFNVNPNKRNNTFLVTEFNKGIVRLLYYDDDKYNTVVKYGINTYKSQIDNQYPHACWDPKGEKFAVMYWQKGVLNFFIYDVINKSKEEKMDFTLIVDQVQDMKFMPNGKTLLLSAIRNGQSDIYTYDLKTKKLAQITNDVYDDHDPTFVALPNKQGVMFSSNRPTPYAPSSDSAIVKKEIYNIFFASDYGDAKYNQVTQLTKMKYGNASHPMDYNESHFTFTSDENGITNRYAGFFSTAKEGLDTLIQVGKDILRNPTINEVDSALTSQKKDDIDTMIVVSISKDSAYVFPITNYESSISESRIAGEKNQVSEVTLQNDEKILYKLKIDDKKLQKRNTTTVNTTYRQKLIDEERKRNMLKLQFKDDAKINNEFQTEFATTDSSSTNKMFEAFDNSPKLTSADVLAKMKHFKYNPAKFTLDNVDGRASASNAEFTGAMISSRYEPYNPLGIGQPGFSVATMSPIRINQQSAISGLTRFGINDVMEDHIINAAYRLGGGLSDNEVMLNYMNMKRRLDWGGTYYRKTETLQGELDFGSSIEQAQIKSITNIYAVKLRYAVNEAFSVRMQTGIRRDRFAFKPSESSNPLIILQVQDKITNFSQSRIEFVYDNSLFIDKNILNGFRAKIYTDVNFEMGSKRVAASGPMMFIFGGDFRYYKPIFRNLIWAFRGAFDFSWGDQKTIFYLGGPDNRVMLNNVNVKPIPFATRAQTIVKHIYPNPVANDPSYSFQGLAIGLRGFKQNLSNGNNNFIINSEFRCPIFGTLIDKPVNNPFLRNLMFTQFIDMGAAWNGQYNKLSRPYIYYDGTPLSARVKAGGIGPIAGAYGFGVRSILFNYYLRFDAGWQMNGVFKGRPELTLSTGFDF